MKDKTTAATMKAPKRSMAGFGHGQPLEMKAGGRLVVSPDRQLGGGKHNRQPVSTVAAGGRGVDGGYQKLDAYKGDTYLWERYPPELIEINKAKGYPTHRQNPAFSPRRLYQWVVQIMQDYQKQTGNDLSSHDFRKAAFTRAAEEDIHPKRAAVAVDVTAETMLRYYTATEKKRTSDEILTGLADRLRPKIKDEEE